MATTVGGPANALSLALLLLLPAVVAPAQQLVSRATTEGTQAPPEEVPCTAAEAECLARGTLWAAAAGAGTRPGACHPPLEQGPCADAQWLVLDPAAPPCGKCAPRPCPPGQLPSTGRCLEEGEAREMCWSNTVHLDASGALRCGASPGWKALLEASVRCRPPDSTPTPSNYTDDYNATAPGNYTDHYNATAPGNSTDDYYMYMNDTAHTNETDQLDNSTDTYYNNTDDDFAGQSGNTTNTPATSNVTSSTLSRPASVDCTRRDDGRGGPQFAVCAAAPAQLLSAIALAALGVLIATPRLT